MPERIRRNRGLARPGKPGSGALPARATRAAWEGWCQQLQCPRRLLGDHAVAERGELRRTPETWGRGDPAGIKALHPLHEVGTEPTGLVRGGRGRTGEPLPSGDGGCVRAPSPLFSSASGDGSVQSGRTTVGKGGHLLLGRRPGGPVSPARGVGSSDAAALGRVKSPLPCRWLGEPLTPSDAFGVGSSSHSTSSARFGPCPPDSLFEGC